MATTAVTSLPAENNGQSSITLAFEADNGENSMTRAIVGVGSTLDGIGGARQIAFITNASANIVSSVGVAAIAASAATIGTLCSGVVSMGFSATATIPDAYRSMKKAEKELVALEAQNTKEQLAALLSELKANDVPVAKLVNGAAPITFEEIDRVLPTTLRAPALKVPPKLESARQMLTIRKLGLVSQSALFVMGAAQTACGVVSMLGSEVASVFHYSTVLSGTVAAVATIATSVALGAICKSFSYRIGIN